MNITVKNVPEKIYNVIKREAKRNRRSINSEVIVALENVAEAVKRRQRLKGMSKELERFRARLPVMDDSAPLIRRDRER